MFLSDYGLHDEFVGLCHAVIARIAPRARVIDLTHGIAPGDLRRGAQTLRDAVAYLPDGAVILAVVDPGVGTKRRAVAVRTGSGRVLVGPDNGLLCPAWEADGGAVQAVEISAPGVVLSPVSPTFHGRDVFAPAAAHLAAGSPLERLGPPVDPATLVRLIVPAARVKPGEIATEVLGVDRFGNVQLSAKGGDLRAAGLEAMPTIEIQSDDVVALACPAATFAGVEPGSLGLVVDSAGRLALVVNRGSAAADLGLDSGDAITLRAARGK